MSELKTDFANINKTLSEKKGLKTIKFGIALTAIFLMSTVQVEAQTLQDFIDQATRDARVLPPDSPRKTRKLVSSMTKRLERLNEKELRELTTVIVDRYGNGAAVDERGKLTTFVVAREDRSSRGVLGSHVNCLKGACAGAGSRWSESYGSTLVTCKQPTYYSDAQAFAAFLAYQIEAQACLYLSPLAKLLD